jgi:hypothetical protein
MVDIEQNSMYSSPYRPQLRTASVPPASFAPSAATRHLTPTLDVSHQ